MSKPTSCGLAASTRDMDTPVRADISAKLSCWPAVIGARVGGLGVNLGVGGNTGSAGGMPVGDCRLRAVRDEVATTPTRRSKAVILAELSESTQQGRGRSNTWSVQMRS